MNDIRHQIATIQSWVGKTYAEMATLAPDAFSEGRTTENWERGMRACWSIVRAAYALRGDSIPDQYHAALDARLFRTVKDPEPFDVVPLCLHKLPIVTHVGLYLGESLVIHALEEQGIVCHPITREPWWSHIARDKAGNRGYLRLRQTHPALDACQPVAPVVSIP